MKKCGAIIAGSAALAALCALWPAFAGAMAEYVSLPAARILARLSALAPVPLAFFVLTAVAIMAKPRVLMALALAAALFAATWAPVMTGNREDIPRASVGGLIDLCARLTDELNSQGRCVPAPVEALQIARRAMNAPAAPKAALFPGIMRRFRLAGIYIPVTGEAVVDITRPAAGLTFTAAHELAHMQGFGCEMQANIAAYEACVLHGGAAAYSARLWALRYAIARLGDDWRHASGLTGVIRRDLAAIPYAAGAAESYAALADYLAAH